MTGIGDRFVYSYLLTYLLTGDHMKNINETFTDEEHEELSSIKEYSGLNWHDFIVEAAKDWMRCEKEDNPSEFKEKTKRL